jgi:hypothetical protein
MSRDMALLSTGDLEKAAKHPRSREDARAIAEELASRRELYQRGDKTPSLFGRGANAERRTPNAQSRMASTQPLNPSTSQPS